MTIIVLLCLAVWPQQCPVGIWFDLLILVHVLKFTFSGGAECRSVSLSVNLLL